MAPRVGVCEGGEICVSGAGVRVGVPVRGEGGEGEAAVLGGGIICAGTPFGVDGDCWARLRH